MNWFWNLMNSYCEYFSEEEDDRINISYNYVDEKPPEEKSSLISTVVSVGFFMLLGGIFFGD